MHPLRLLGLLFIVHALGIVGFVVHRDNQGQLLASEESSSVEVAGNLSVNSDPTGGRSSPGEVLKRYEMSRISSRTIMLVIAAGLGLVGVICTAAVSGKE